MFQGTQGWSTAAELEPGPGQQPSTPRSGKPPRPGAPGPLHTLPGPYPPPSPTSSAWISPRLDEAPVLNKEVTFHF